jgi:NADPH2:quinone reductase
MKAIVVKEFGGPERLVYEDAAKPEPKKGEAIVKLSVSGVNFIDIYFRTGLYKAPLPLIPGMEGAGVVDSVGEGVTEVQPGDRVVYCMNRGSYAEYAAVQAWQLVAIPSPLSEEDAAAVILQGMTAHYLTHSTYSLKPGDTVLLHAAAGGTGQLIAQLAKMLGARVIGTVGSQAKAAIAREAGCDEVIVYTEQDFEAATKALTGGKGVNVVYDSVGASTFEKSLNSLRPRGTMVTFGNASGAVPPMEPLVLSQKGSLFLTRPTLNHYAATRDELERRAGNVLGWVATGKLKVRIDKVYPLADAAQAQIDLAGRATAGKLLLRIG